MNTFGARLRALRKRKDLSQEEVATALGYSRVQVSNWEIERSEPDIQTLDKLSNFYGVSVGYITGSSDDPGTPEQKTEDQVIVNGKAYKRMKTLLQEGHLATDEEWDIIASVLRAMEVKKSKEE